jgi:hypothetical protein
MSIENIVPVLPVDDLASAVATWSAILGAAPTFVDGDRWAQFDVAGRRLALAGTDRSGDMPGIMLKVPDLAAARARLLGEGIALGEPQEGAHEIRCSGVAPGGWPIVLYSPRPR